MASRRQSARISSQRAVSLLEVMVLVAIIAILAMILMRMFENSQKASNRLFLRDDLFSMKQVIRQRLSCAQTFKTATCPLAKGFALKDAKGNVIGTQNADGISYAIGKWSYIASCDPNNLLAIGPVMPSGSSYKSDPLHTNVTYDPTYANDHPMYDAGELSCNGFSNPVASGDCSGPFCPQQQGKVTTVVGDLVLQSLGGVGSRCGSLVPQALGNQIDPDNPNRLWSTYTPYLASSNSAVPRLYSGSATCPTGTTLISGGVKCNPAPYGGTTDWSGPDPTNKTWTGTCCVYYDAANGSLSQYPNHVVAKCIDGN